MTLCGGTWTGAHVVLGVAGVAALTLLAAADPATSPLFPPCLWRAATGWQCPGCGSARAIHALLHGNVSAALRMNPLVVLAMPLCAADLAQRWRGRGRRGRGRRGRGRRGEPLTAHVRPSHLYAVAVVIVMFGVLRNVSY